MVVDYAIREERSLAPRLIEEFFAAQYTPTVTHEGTKELELRGRDVDGRPGSPQLTSCRVDFDVGESKHRRSFRRRVPSQGCADARAKFLGAERLGDVV